MLALEHLKGRRIAILGLGRAGRAVARAAVAGGAASVVVHDDNPDAVARAGLSGVDQADLATGPWPVLDLLVTSPGLAHLYPHPHRVIARAWEAGVPVDNEIGLYFAEIAAAGATVICITGTNGKSTTTALTRHLVAQSGRAVHMGGNIGVPVFDLERPEPGDIVVLELSSYQTDQARRLDPDIAVFLNLTPDHYDRHGGRGGYFAAKRRLFEVGRPAVSVVGTDEEEGRFLANMMRAAGEPGGSVAVISATRPPVARGLSYTFSDGAIAETRDGAERARYPLTGIGSLRGIHNAQNAAAAIAAVRAAGLDAATVAAGLATFPGLAHRLEVVGRAGKVLFVNDSKATNADAAARALASFQTIYWIAGGKPKAGGIADLAPFFGRIVKAYLIGEAEAEFAATLEGVVDFERCGTLAAATAAAARDAAADTGAEPVVLLSPACASFDQFRSFEERGEVFRSLAAGLEGVTIEGEA
ncbi:UDP-N-acetylmuramoyl-L-alanine--D-glutamate ligase [Pseudoxanthobacter sp.]|uniref:UDP-N-acetylmuramoyl-L-alanine--D-glutamate ligase n=1 Tax=Pseudoxanthobacter sp. TaxID=1925742 RepID=UPI002FE21681